METLRPRDVENVSQVMRLILGKMSMDADPEKRKSAQRVGHLLDIGVIRVNEVKANSQNGRWGNVPSPTVAFDGNSMVTGINIPEGFLDLYRRGSASGYIASIEGHIRYVAKNFVRRLS